MKPIDWILVGLGLLTWSGVMIMFVVRGKARRRAEARKAALAAKTPPKYVPPPTG